MKPRPVTTRLFAMVIVLISGTTWVLAEPAVAARPASTAETAAMIAATPAGFAPKMITNVQLTNGRISTIGMGSWAAADVSVTYASDGSIELGTALFAILENPVMDPTKTKLEVWIPSPASCQSTREAYIEDVITDDLQLVAGTWCGNGLPAWPKLAKVRAIRSMRNLVNARIKRLNGEFRRCGREHFTATSLSDCMDAAASRTFRRPFQKLLRNVRRVRDSISWGDCYAEADRYDVALGNFRDDFESIIASVYVNDTEQVRLYGRQLRKSGRRARSAWIGFEANCSYREKAPRVPIPIDTD